jgi:putative ABC transport system permease protein
MGSGIDEDEGLKIRGEKWAWNTIAGRPLKESEDGLMLGIGLAQRLGCQFSAQIRQNKDGSYVPGESPLQCPAKEFQLSVTTEHSQVNAVSIPPLGVADFQIREFNDKVLAMPLATAQRLLDTDRISRYSVLLEHESQISAFKQDFSEKAQAAGLDLETLAWIDHPLAAMSKGGGEILKVFRGLFLTVVAVIAAMSVANSMMKSINERIREIGTLRSFGFRKGDIIWLFSLEGLFLGLFSCLGGILVSALLAFVLRNLGLTFNAGVLSTPLPLNFSFAFRIWFGTAAGLSLITFCTAWLVSRRAAGMVIADALRHTA